MPLQATMTLATAAAATALALACNASSSSCPPSSIPGHGTYKGSHLPAGAAWNSYNYCNAPHVNAAYYPSPPSESELVYVTSFQRHAKRTPDNLLPGTDAESYANPQSGWDCSNDYEVLNYANGGQAGVRMKTEYSIPEWNPMRGRLWNGSCSSGQLTRAGWEDARMHGRDFMKVYGPEGLAQILGNHGQSDNDMCDSITVRASPSARTAQVASAFLAGMGVCKKDLDGSQRSKKLIVQPDTMDGIVPSYSCAHADSLRTAIEATPEWKRHLTDHAQVFAALHESLPTTKGVRAWNSWINHSFDLLTSRQCHGHSLPAGGPNAPAVNQSLANQVYAAGDWEYDYIWNRASSANDSSSGALADEYVRYGTAVLVDELARDLKAVEEGRKGMPLVKLFVGHDGTMVRMLKTLAQSGTIRWPALGSEVVFEVWRHHAAKDSEAGLFVRVFAYGTLLHSKADKLRTNNLSDRVEWTPLRDIIAHLESRIPDDLVEKCTAAPSTS